jgi:hypothetical protein
VIGSVIFSIVSDRDESDALHEAASIVRRREATWTAAVLHLKVPDENLDDPRSASFAIFCTASFLPRNREIATSILRMSDQSVLLWSQTSAVSDRSPARDGMVPSWSAADPASNQQYRRHTRKDLRHKCSEIPHVRRTRIRLQLVIYFLSPQEAVCRRRRQAVNAIPGKTHAQKFP